ncbi:4333_t:CDS:2 [Funneliformis mosseae]|uniref:4333_t:CDS:1 n=1 Tax=Funneliformis mosseae TaxID=27381 RepID=A0A9N9AUE7_FUNMO|nr:4333_t:CDS:2 [Funneliformis mosseae]
MGNHLRKFLRLFSRPMVPLNQSQIEEERWDEIHYLLKEYWGGDFSAPIHEWLQTGGIKVLDIGCGNGLWLKDIAINFPSSEFIGVDNDNISLLPENSPSNIKFIQEDIKSTLPFEANTFDYVHMRHMMFYFTEIEWINVVIPELIRILKPGGYLELEEADQEWRNVTPTTRTFTSIGHNLMRQRGIDPFLTNHLDDIMESTEMLDDIHRKVQEVQIGKWAGHKVKVSYRERLNISNNEFDNLIQRIKREVDEHKTYCNHNRFYATKKCV